MTNVQHIYDRKKLFILCAVLAVIGGAVAALSLWQYFVYFPNAARREFKIGITVVSSVVCAAIFGLSAKPLYRLGEGIAKSTGALASRMGAKGIAAIVLGLLAAGAFAYLCDVVVRSVLDIWAVRLLSDILVFIVLAALLCYGFTKWLSAPVDKFERAPSEVGYLLAFSCFTDDRVITAADTLIGAKVLDGAYKALCLYGDAHAVKRLDALVKSGAVRLVPCNNDFSSKDEYSQFERQFAERKRLKIIELICSGEGGDSTLSLGVFTRPSDERLLDILGAETTADGGAASTPQTA
ncbi:MAG: hypothetical protein J1G01_00290 [Clostridiales bacterium]|nr:hypothetical protein [Clostridiales bacterium]